MSNDGKTFSGVLIADKSQKFGLEFLLADPKRAG